MSQDEEDAAIYEYNFNSKHYYHYNGNNNNNNNIHTNNVSGNLNQQVMPPLYENFTINNNSSNKKHQQDHSTVEHDPNKSETFNFEYRFVSNATTDFQSEKARDKDTILPNNDCDEYENVIFPHATQLDKKILLQKYFRSALVGPRTNIYENLCRGCNYGVFNARGPLCSFCECIVNGVHSIKSGDTITDDCSLTASKSNNIYENICEYCGLLYSDSRSETESECKCQLDNFVEKETAAQKRRENGSEELLIGKKEKTKIKLAKSKSFNKSLKPKLFANFWDTLRKPKSTTAIRKPLEIIHNVEGFDEVFHTKDTFDLQKICELKRNGTSCSDQHIYGRLKRKDLAEDFNSTQSLTLSAATSVTGIHCKKPRISKPKFLRTQSIQTPLPSNEAAEHPFIYLNDSVCQWMTSLRREVITYNTIDDEDDDTQCYPKSIPSKKNVLISCKAPVTNTNTNLTNIPTNLRDILNQRNSFNNLTEIVTLRRHNAVEESWDSLEATAQQPKDFYQLMIEEFIKNILSRQQQFNMKARDKQFVNAKALTMAGVNNNDSYNNNNNGQSNSNSNNNNNIPLRQATLTSTNNNNNRHKRQGMYLRSGDHHHHHHHQEQQQVDENLQNNFNNNIHHIDQHVEEKSNELNNEYENFLNSPNETNTVTKRCSPCNDHLHLVSSHSKTNVKGLNFISTDKRQGIHELNVLEAFEAILRKEQDFSLKNLPKEKENLETIPLKKESHLKEELSKKESCLELQTFGVVRDLDDNDNTISSLHFPKQILDVVQLIKQQQLSSSLNTIIICYDSHVRVFLRCIAQTNKEQTNKQLVRKFHKFYTYCHQLNCPTTTTPKNETRALTNVSSNLKLDLIKTNDCASGNFQKAKEINNDSYETETKTTNGLMDCRNDKNTSVINKTDTKTHGESNKEQVRTPPQVPKRDPKTKLSPTLESKSIVGKNSFEMTKPVTNLIQETTNETIFKNAAAKENEEEEEESIYQPIWKFKTKGQVSERYLTDDDYYDIKDLREKMQQQDHHPNISDIPKILISNDQYLEVEQEEEDHNNWEPDEEFVFTKQMKKHRSSSLTSEQNSTIRSNHSSNSSIGTSSSLSGSTITEFASSTATLASTVSTSLMHHLFRNIGIFYSLTEPKLRAIIYDYDRVHSSAYFAKPHYGHHSPQINDSGLGKSLSPLQPPKLRKAPEPPTSSAAANSLTSSPTGPMKRENLGNLALQYKASESENVAPSSSSSSSATAVTTSPLIPASVQAWKYQLLNVNYMEDEEDMIVSESAILQAQKVKDTSATNDIPPPVQLQNLSRFISRSTDNILELPIEDDKKTIVERFTNMYSRFSPIQKGILNINSPKSKKKAYKLNRTSQVKSLYLDDGLKPKPPIFGAALEQLELQQNVPRFVVDAVDYIERKDRIVQDGLYRACGNKFFIDELKQKLTKSYIYDSKLITSDDIHTITSLLKQFFRDLTTPLIPQPIYTRITTNLNDKLGIDAIRIAFQDMREPNKSTLRFLIKHLTNVAVCSPSNRMNASNLAIVWGPSLFAQNDTYDMIGRMNTLTKVLIENYDRIFDTNERLL